MKVPEPVSDPFREHRPSALSRAVAPAGTMRFQLHTSLFCTLAMVSVPLLMVTAPLPRAFLLALDPAR